MSHRISCTRDTGSISYGVQLRGTWKWGVSCAARSRRSARARSRCVPPSNSESYLTTLIRDAIGHYEGVHHQVPAANHAESRRAGGGEPYQSGYIGYIGYIGYPSRTRAGRVTLIISSPIYVTHHHSGKRAVRH